jgi:hypothetical protein
MNLDPTLDAVDCGYIAKRYVLMLAHHANPATSVASHSGWDTAGLRNQVLHTLTNLCANTGPIVHTFQVKPETFFLASGQRIKKTNSFNTTSITFATTVCNNYVIERPFFSATARKTNLYHSLKPFAKANNLAGSCLPALH